MTDPAYRHGKRLLDVLLAGTLLVLLAPLLGLLALAIVLDTPGRPWFVQERVGWRGRRFRIYKLRSMVTDAEARLPGLREAADLPGPVFKLRHDPRVTPVGRLLRRTSLDEAPQLLNVIRGEMSLVGPRPLPPSQVDVQDPRFARRTDVLPGLTGLWQVTGRVMHVAYDEWLAMDCAYVEQQSMALDLAILLRTPLAVARGEGAY